MLGSHQVEVLVLCGGSLASYMWDTSKIVEPLGGVDAVQRSAHAGNPEG